MQQADLAGGALSFVAALERFFFEPLRFRGLYVMRAALGAIALFHYLRLLPHVQALFGPAGINGYDTAQRWPTFPMPVTEDLEHFALLGHVSSPALVVLLYVLLLLASAAFMLGLRARWSGLLLALLHLIFASHQPGFDGWVRLFGPFVVYVALAPSGGAFSLDAWLAARRGRPLEPPPFAAWPLRLLQVHVIAMYATAGWPRLVAEAWLRGETVLYAVADSRFGRWDIDYYALRGALSLLTWAALVLEPAATLLLPWRLTRRWCALALMVLHLGIEALADTGMWQFMMCTALLAFLPDSWFARLPGLRLAGRERVG